MQRNRISNEKREYAKSVSLLAGLMFDEFGRKMISTHAVKTTSDTGTTCRQRTTTAIRTTKQPKLGFRLRRSTTLFAVSLQTYLTNSARLARLFHNFRSDPAIIKRGIDAAAKLALDIVANDASIPDIVRKLIRQLDAHPDRLLIALDLGALIRTLAGEGAADIHSDEIQETMR
jgi:hypothetical protein